MHIFGFLVALLPKQSKWAIGHKVENCIFDTVLSKIQIRPNCKDQSTYHFTNDIQKLRKNLQVDETILCDHYSVCVRSARENAHFQLTISGRVLVFASEILGNIFTHQNGNGKSIIPVQNWKILSGRNDSLSPFKEFHGLFDPSMLLHILVGRWKWLPSAKFKEENKVFIAKKVLFINKSMKFLSLKGIFLLYE